MLDVLVARDLRLELDRDGVDVRGGEVVGGLQPMTARIGDNCAEQLARPLPAVKRYDGLERLDPLPRLSGVYVDEIGHVLDGS